MKKSDKEKRVRKNKDSKGIRLAARWKKGVFSVLFSRLGLVVIMLLIQVFMLISIWVFLGEFMAKYAVGTQTALEILVLLILFNSPMNSTAKLSWMLLIGALPLFGSIFYLWTQLETGHRSIKKKLNKLNEISGKMLPQNQTVKEKLENVNPESAAIAEYLYNIGGSPVFDGTETEYYPVGEKKFPRMLEELEKAEKFIFLEYFIIEEGYMWGKVLEILARKVEQGVEVRVMYDGSCEFSTLPYDYPKRIRKLGIQCKTWEPIKPVITSAYNYRDHRKILVIDGKTAFCGGINLADEYINHTVRYGYWKDTAVMLRGAAVDSFTLMFLQMWNVKEKETEQFSKYFHHYDKDIRANGFVIPYSDSPLNDHKIAERVYMDMLYTAKKYVYIMTPYLILDDEISTALRYTAQRGVDVRLILPGIPDKKAIWALAKSHYRQLIASGVKIYEYTPGFIHAKGFLSDDTKAVVGSINLDYRSLYHHFECAVYMYGSSCIKDISDDFQKTFSECRKVTSETIKKERFATKVTGAVLKLIAPLL